MAQWRIVPIAKIDSEKWDACICRQNREVFSEYWYWEAVCNSWQAWVKGDYEDVLALPIERKWGLVPFMRTPLYVKWIEGDTEQLQLLIQAFFGFRRVHLPFEWKGANRKSFQLLMLLADWMPSKELTKNIRKAESQNPEFVESVDWTDFSAFMLKHHPYAWPDVQQKTMQKLYSKASSRGVGRIAGVKMNGQWAAMQFYIRDKSKAYLIQNVVPTELRSLEPMPFLLGTLLRQWQSNGDSVRVNFMGSNHAGVARFNEKFGAVNSYYWEFP
jgi:hypothetical protein